MALSPSGILDIERTYREAIGADLRRLRKRAGMSQQEVADQFGWGRDAISKIERGESDTTVEKYLRILKCLGPADPAHPGVVLARRIGR